MPGQDRTGPMGRGPRTGRGAGLCNGRGNGQGFGRGRGMGLMNRGRNFFGRQTMPNRQDLEDYVSDLEAELKEAKEALKKDSDD